MQNASGKGFLEIVKVLVDSGGDINHRFKPGSQHYGRNSEQERNDRPLNSVPEESDSYNADHQTTDNINTQKYHTADRVQVQEKYQTADRVQERVLDEIFQPEEDKKQVKEEKKEEKMERKTPHENMKTVDKLSQDADDIKNVYSIKIRDIEQEIEKWFVHLESVKQERDEKIYEIEEQIKALLII
ncbi:DNA topoisomerase 1 isoform X3 [Eurytemora carolleeae]|uniref:DNA topoisomerase 1 isoform X3 n=1 Tax=Eurytemora carolleeae TaxID=1294199 RepID=UPI000C78C54F|nr:DNA topoisomerase 1 isoform X3 [Eurytemora carolleeae]|eukprot:XP_023320614.1 DNA topoisomerase 1-like isoform X3 [Eurytemora affinis]